MVSLSTLLDAYLDVNILLAFACCLWFVTARGLRALGLSHTYTAQLKTVRLVFLAIILAPLAMAGLMLVVERAGVQFGNPVNLTDFIVAQYLQGRFEMDPAKLEAILGARRQLSAGYIAGSADLVYWLGVALALGFLIFVARLLASMWKLNRVLDDSFAWRRFGRLELRLSENTVVPFSTRGLLRRIVVLPSSMLAEPDDMRIALGHELQHIRQRDVDWEIWMECLKPFFFWNPAFHIWRRQVEELRELSCDRQVLDRKGYDVAAYCQCLLRVCHNSLKRKRLFGLDAPVVALVQTENRLFGHRSAHVLRTRMEALIDGKAEKRPTALAALMLAPLIGLTFLAAISIQRPGDWSQDRLMLSTIINLERLEMMNANSTLKVPGY
jgi:beta-lactamase regulating signal transducer with metallopeptidase domain